jgi:hypothetical protein
MESGQQFFQLFGEIAYGADIRKDVERYGDIEIVLDLLDHHHHLQRGQTKFAHQFTVLIQRLSRFQEGLQDIEDAGDEFVVIGQ